MSLTPIVRDEVVAGLRLTTMLSSLSSNDVGRRVDGVVVLVGRQRLGQRGQEPTSSHCTGISTTTTCALPLPWTAGSITA